MNESMRLCCFLSATSFSRYDVGDDLGRRDFAAADGVCTRVAALDGDGELKADGNPLNVSDGETETKFDIELAASLVTGVLSVHSAASEADVDCKR